MFWAERIEWIKQTYELSPADFRVHHTDWVNIMQKTEPKFIVKHNSNEHFNSWMDNLKPKRVDLNLDCNHRQFFNELFEKEVNYWFVLVFRPLFAN